MARFFSFIEPLISTVYFTQPKTLGETSAYTDKLPSVESMIDKLAKRGIIHKNKAANLKSKLAKKKVAA